MKKVCHLTSVHQRYDVRIFEKECISLANNGFDTYLIVNDDKENEQRQGVSIISTKYNPNNRIKRMIYSGKAILREANKINADIYHLHDPELLSIALNLKNKKKKVIFDSHEDVPGQILGKHWIPKVIRRIISLLYTLYESYVLKRIDAVISVTPHLTNRLEKINKNVVEITNYPKLSSTLKTNYDRKRTICFAGCISPRWMHEIIIKAVETVPNVKYIMCGPEVNNYTERLKNLKGWKQVEYLGVIPHNEVQKVYGQSMIGLAIADYNENVKGNLGTLGNTKLFEIMLAGLPVICTDFVLWKKIIDEYQCGIYVQPNNVEEIASAIRYLIDNPNVARNMGENGRKVIFEECNWNIEEKKLIKLYKYL